MSAWWERHAPTCPRAARAPVLQEVTRIPVCVRRTFAKKKKPWTVAKRGLSRWLRYHTVRSCLSQQRWWAETEGWHLRPPDSTEGSTKDAKMDGSRGVNTFDLLSALRSNKPMTFMSNFSFSKHFHCLFLFVSLLYHLMMTAGTTTTSRSWSSCWWLLENLRKIQQKPHEQFKKKVVSPTWTFKKTFLWYIKKQYVGFENTFTSTSTTIYNM